MSKKKLNIHNIKSRWLRGLVAWALFPPTIILVFVLILVESMYAGGVVLLGVAKERWGETWIDIIKPNVRTLLFRRDT